MRRGPSQLVSYAPSASPVDWTALEPRLFLSSHRAHKVPFPAAEILPPIKVPRLHQHHASQAGYPLVHGQLVARRKPKTSSTGGSAIPADAGGNSPLSSVPQLSSRPGATAKLYLDFIGAPAQHWGTYNVPTTPAYDTDGDPTTFSSTELANISQIWARVAEKYSPFNLDVTTIDPGVYPHKVVQRIVIGGDSTWTPQKKVGGISYVGAFASPLLPNTSWVFPVELLNGDPKDTAEATSHEAGHAFGLQHQSVWSGNTLVQEYNPGDSLRAPVMGVSYSAARGLWWYGTDDREPGSIQDDLAVLSGSTNGFGYRPDDHGNTIATADLLVPTNGNTISATGVIERNGDVDDFSFTTGAGTDTFTLSVAPNGPTLDGTLRILNIAGTVIATADTASLGESLSLNLAAGSYYLSISGHGNYGDLGQYSITGTINPPQSAPQAPSNLAASVVSPTQVSLTWTPNDLTATGLRVLRSTDGVNFSQVGPNLAPLTNSYQDTTASPATTYSYEIVAYGFYGVSNPSNIAIVTTPDAPGTGLTGTYFSDEDLTTPVLTRTDPTINFNWSTGSPDPIVPADGFSARWTGRVKAQYSENYTFTFKADDGVRLWVNGQLLIDQWNALPPLLGDVNVDGSVDAADISLITGSGHYNDGTPGHTTGDGDVNGDGFVDFDDILAILGAGAYGVRQQPATYSASIALQAGQKCDVHLEYFDHTGFASAELDWSSPTTPLQVIPQTQLYNS
jgi:hypothetical protein